MCAAVALVVGATVAVRSFGGPDLVVGFSEGLENGATSPSVPASPAASPAAGPAAGPAAPGTTPETVPRATPRPSPPAVPPEPATSSEAGPAPRPVRIPADGDGDFVVVPVEEPALSADQVSYTVEIEEDLPFRGVPAARTIEAVLDDERGWVGVLGTTFRQATTDPDLRILLATPATTDELCAPLQTLGRVSCRDGDLVVLNARRWAFGISDYEGNLAGYRTYLVNHEVGHTLGAAHVECPGTGLPAPVMQQQTYGLDGCVQNPWPTVG